MAAIAVALVAAVVLTVVLTRPDGAPVAGGEVFLQAAGASGPDPYTGSSARKSSPATSPPAPPSASTPTSTATSGGTVTRGVQGSAPGLYGGTRDAASCDVEKQITALTAEPAKNKAFASVLSIEPSAVPAYLRKLTPVQLRMDTRVTNHGYRNGSPTSYQAVLQSGTAVLVDDRGVPRVRCACGNPLLPPVAVQGTPRRTGDNWPAYRPSNVVVVAPAVQVVNVFIIFDPRHEEWFARDAGDTGGSDKKTPPPVTDPAPSADTSTTDTSSPSTSGCPSPSVSGSGSGSGSPDPGGSTGTCPPSSASPSSPSSPPESSPSSPSSEPPSSEPPTSQLPPESSAEDSPAQPSTQSGSATAGGVS